MTPFQPIASAIGSAQEVPAEAIRNMHIRMALSTDTRTLPFSTIAALSIVSIARAGTLESEWG